MTPAVLSASTLKGDQVVNREGEKLGSLKDLMIDLEEGRVAYAVLSRGGIGRLGEKLFAIPWELLTVDGDARQVVLDLSPDVLEDSTGFDPDNWPSFSDREWRRDIDRRFGVEDESFADVTPGDDQATPIEPV